MTKQKRGISPIIGLVLVLLLGAFGIVAGNMVTSRARATFLEEEKDYPESAITLYLEHIRNKDFDGIYEDSLVIAPHINSKEDYINKLQEIYKDVDIDQIVFAPIESDSKNLKYALAYDKKYLSTLELMKSKDNRWLASTIFSGDNEYTVEVPTGLKLKVNGIEIGKEYMMDKKVVASNFLGMDYPQDAPHVDRYLLSNLLGAPQIEVMDSSKKYGTLVDVVNGIIYVGEAINDKELENVFIEDAKICAMLPAQEVGLGSVAAISVLQSDWYDRISTMQNTWFTGHGVSNFSNEKAFNIIKQSDNSMVGFVTFDYYASNGEVDRTWNCGYQISFIQEYGVWKIAGMGIDSTLNPKKKTDY
ncbi:MAG: hypothetical protein IKE51_06105 [Solobacterium sp.]|nr:hypothetical protein [Solobacterium sp.]